MSIDNGVKLIEFAKYGNLDALRHLIVNGCDVDYRCPPDGATALYWAACNGHLSVCDWLVSQGASVNQSVEKSGSLPLHGAADRGHVDCVHLLIRKGCQIDAKTRSNGDTALHLAAYRGHLDVCRVLLQHNASVDIHNAQGCTALEEAQTQSHYDVHRLLWKHRQRQQSFLKEKSSSTSCLSNVSHDSQTSSSSNHRKMITEMLSTNPSRISDEFEPDKDGKHIPDVIELHNHPDRPCHTKRLSYANSSRNKASGKVDIEYNNPESIQGSETVLIRCNSEQNDASNSPITSHVKNYVTGDAADNDVTTHELIRKLDKLVEYSEALQVQLTIRQDENDQVIKENRKLSRRLDFFKKIADTIESMNSSRAESEQRALRAEKELSIWKQRYETLERTNWTLENRLSSNGIRPNCSFCSRKTQNNRYDSVEIDDELQPRG